MRVKVHVEGIKGSGEIKEGEEPSALFYGILEVDGTMIDEVTQIEAVFSGRQFAVVKPHLVPGAFEVVTHTQESWTELIQKIQAERVVRDGAHRTIAVKGDGEGNS